MELGRHLVRHAHWEEALCGRADGRRSLRAFGAVSTVLSGDLVMDLWTFNAVWLTLCGFSRRDPQTKG